MQDNLFDEQMTTDEGNFFDIGAYSLVAHHHGLNGFRDGLLFEMDVFNNFEIVKHER